MIIANVARALTLALVTLTAASCGDAPPLAPKSQTFAELRTVRRGVTVEAPDERGRAPYPRERLADGAKVHVAAGGLAWLRRDGGATMLVEGPAELTAGAHDVRVDRGRVFVDAPTSEPTKILTPSGALALARVRVSLEVGEDRAARAYVLSGEARSEGGTRAGAGERLSLSGEGSSAKATVEPVLSWTDWTGGLATTDRGAEPAPFGLGTVGARPPGSDGAARSPLAIQKLDVNVKIVGDLAITEVDERFFNPSSQVVEGIYRFRTPGAAILERFGVDRDGLIMWGRVKEKAAAAAQYQANVYEGSREDPALLEWEGDGTYRAKLYPIGPGETRRVVVRYAEWLGRTGAQSERRLYVYPMAAEGAEASLPHIEDMTATFDVAAAGAKDVRMGMAGVRTADTITVRAQDFVPRADLALELYDDGLAEPRGYLAPHVVAPETLAPADRAEALKRAATEADYVLVPVRASDVPEAPAGLDLAIIIDTSAKTEASTLALAQATTRALLTHLGDDDRVLVWAGDDKLRPLSAADATFAKVDEPLRRRVLSDLGRAQRGGATDLGALLAGAAASLDPKRHGAVVYIGDGRPTVGELSLGELSERMAKLPRPVRVFGLGVGDDADMALLQGISRGAFAERIEDGRAAARAALRLFELAERPASLGAKVDLGPNVTRVYPRDLGALSADESVVVVGRLASKGAPPTALSITSELGVKSSPLKIEAIEDSGDLGRRWATGRLGQLLEEEVGRAALVDLGQRHGLITPYTSLYVPSKSELAPAELSEMTRHRANVEEANERTPAKKESGRGFLDFLRSKDEAEPTAQAPAAIEVTSTAQAEAKGEEGAMGKATPSPSMTAAAPAPPRGAAAAEPAPDAAMPVEAEEQSAVAREARPRPAAPRYAVQGPVDAPRTGADSNGLGLSGIGEGGGGRGSRGDLGGIGTLGHGSGFGSGSGLKNKAIAGNTDGVADTLAKRATIRQGEPIYGSSVQVIIDLPRHPLYCSAAADVPFGERVQLWRERLGRASGSPTQARQIYEAALYGCEAPTWRERSRLLAMMLDAMGTVTQRVSLWREMRRDLGAADTLYRGLVARVTTPSEVRELHAALGLETMDPSALEKTLAEAKTPALRAAALRKLWIVWPSDFTIARRLLDALEDLGDGEAARALGAELRARPDADAVVRTSAGELYLRLAAKATSPEQRARDEAEARRSFGEIVEFSPNDPSLRRRLGDLLRAHGFYAEAARQYETLARLVPEDPSNAILLASVAEGVGKLEEALRWTDKAGAAGSPDLVQSPATTARAYAVTYLAWAEIAATEAGHADEAKAFAARRRRASTPDKTKVNKGARVVLTWSHPELHPTLWTNALGAAMPAPEGDMTLGIAQAFVPPRSGAFVEVRLDPADVEHAARLGATATLTFIFDEGGAEERVIKRQVSFEGADARAQRLMLANHEVSPSSVPSQVKP